jgi:hypothetical protein
MELRNSGLLVRHIGENGSSCDGIDASVRNSRQPVGGAFDEGALVQDASFCSQHFRAVQQRRGYVGENDAQRSPNAANRAKGNETITGADVGKRHSRLKIGAVEYAICICLDLNTQRCFKTWITTIA